MAAPPPSTHAVVMCLGGRGDNHIPVYVHVPEHVAQIAAGGMLAAAVSTDGRLYVWNAQDGESPKLITLPSISKVKMAACGGQAWACVTGT